MRSQQLGPHTYYVQGSAGPASRENRGFNSNAGFVVTSGGVVVFDALGTPALGQALLAEIRRRTSAPIRRVILSHYHADHAYGLGPLRTAGAEIWAHPGARLYLDSELARLRQVQRREALAPWVPADFQLVEPDHWLDGDLSFVLGDVTFEVRHVGPAHSPEDLSMLVLPDGVMFAGDLVFAGRIPFLGEADSARWLAALDRLDDPRARILVPGHGAASTDWHSALRLTRTYLTDLRAQMRQAVADLLPFDEAYARADWRAWSSLAGFAEGHRANAYTVYLEMERESLTEPPATASPE
ncbi:MBL fold metallo-hydrolase [Fontimonas thermophila]|uniref:MBL fold metallo-hydrolase n=1 Tax=Fontimonas thermophila TaxID=1076937 RepID=UPI001F318B4A|nr:MBL fold metallo-hydrolase [Fontimonas thermophila]